MASAAISLQKEEVSCHFCDKSSKYTCPRCKVPYCSKACYNDKQHMNCSEDFYKELVKAELQDVRAPEGSREKMLEILERVNKGEGQFEEEVMDSDDDEHISSRLDGVDLEDSDTIWNKLTKEERENFKKIVNSGDVSKILDFYEPWWMKKYPDKPKVVDINEPETNPKYAEVCPPVLNVLPLSQVTKSKPSSCVPFNILNILASYSWTVRLFNGDHDDNCLEATEAVLTLSPVLACDANFEEAVMAIDSVGVTATNHTWLRENDDFIKTVRSDVRLLIEGPNKTDGKFYVQSALSDIVNVFMSAKTHLSKKKKPNARKKQFTSSFVGADQHVNLKLTSTPLLKKAIKKLEFLISFSREYRITPDGQT